ncbi:hypothetical protein EVAR_36994_1 [Eumeta japonica]|uniref:Uncharacterized protein n=1 Tax=Eumeta variegata TaxID=151549 RepID=A0A4C1X0Z5_EUMVA|nr:hypothetical protein EVAR_36994_1 [Eumeta japonica]
MKDFMHLTHTDAKACPNLLVGHSFVSLYHEPHSTDVVFGRRRRRTSLTQIISQINEKIHSPIFFTATPGACSEVVFALQTGTTRRGLVVA